jgi:LacI family transcriptional regulator, gluconate utilization system Gnt-I transcriptional repressor
MTKPRRITLEDVAKLANVSAITVSRALRQPDSVSDKLRAHIDEAVNRLGYVPNLAASRLASAKTHTVGVIVPTLYNVIFADYIRAIHDVLLPAGLQPLVTNSQYSVDVEEAAIRTLVGQNVEAIIIVGTDHTPSGRRMLQQARIPVVETFTRSADPMGFNVGLDLEQAGYDATKFLIDLGHKDISFLVGAVDERARQRIAGYTRAMEAASLDAFRSIRCLQEPNSVALGTKLAQKIASTKNMPTAWFCIDDNVALGALSELKLKAFDVPSDVAVFGFHNLDFAACAVPAISTIATDRYMIGEIAAKLTLSELERQGSSTKKWYDVGYELMPRDSTGEMKPFKTASKRAGAESSDIKPTRQSKE